MPDNTQPHGKPDDHGNPEVEVLYLKSSDDAKFHVSWSDTLQTIWDLAYEKLTEKKHPEDRFECQDGTVLTPHLGLTLEQARDQKICQDRKFQIRGPAGGA
jgi:hypothetical protein